MKFICFDGGNKTLREDKITRMEAVFRNGNQLFLLVEERNDGEYEWLISEREYDKIRKTLDIIHVW